MSQLDKAAIEQIKTSWQTGFQSTDMPVLWQALRQLQSADLLIRAGNWCSQIPLDHVLAAGGVACRIALTGNFSMQGLAAPLRARLLAQGIYATDYVSGYAQYCHELLTPGSELYQSQPDAVICLLDEHEIWQQVAGIYEPAAVAQALQDCLNRLVEMAHLHAQQAQGILIFNTLAVSADQLKQRIDAKSRAQILRHWYRFNADLAELAERFSQVLIIDPAAHLSQAMALRDERFSFYAKAHMSEELLALLASEIAGLIGARLGRSRKALVLDLDNTLWGGILGDDGVDGIQLLNTPEGEAFVAFQKVIRRLTQQGIMLAISSKNDLAKVQEAFTQRDDLVLKQSDFLAIQANWEPKSIAMATIAQDLNIGIDSLVFLDDSAYECAEVAQAHPLIWTQQLSEEPAEHIHRLMSLDAWTQIQLTGEDLKRVEMYRSDKQRDSLAQQCGSMSDFLASLQLKLHLSHPLSAHLTRVAQLTQRTNQFNLTTWRLSEPEVQQFIEQKGWVIAMHSEDRFGEHGLIGAIFCHPQGEDLHIDNMLMSCRVFSRQIEQAALSAVLKQAQARGFKQVYARYIPTAKNTQFKDFYPQQGFSLVNHASDGTRHYVHHLSTLPTQPTHIHLNSKLEWEELCWTN